jgi:hypothetical protein
MLTYYETPEGDFSPNIQEACDRLVRELYATGLFGAKLRCRLGLAPRSPFMRFYHAHGNLPDSYPERSFVEEMRALGIEERQQIYLGTDARSWSDFPETHEYLLRAVSRLEKKLEVARLEQAKLKAAELKSAHTQSHPAATLADILGPTAANLQRQKQPNK